MGSIKLLAGVVMSSLVLSACVSSPVQPVADPDRIEVLLDRHASRISQAWSDLAQTHRDIGAPVRRASGVDHGAMGELGRALGPIKFSGSAEEFLSFISYGSDWVVLPSEGRRVGTAMVTLESGGGMTFQDALEAAGSQVTGVADVIVSVQSRSIRLRYRGQ